MSELDATSARRRFLLLRGLRWLPTGLVIPIMVLLLLDRGFSLAQIGLITAAQGFAVLLLELPTGGLADSLGRRRMLLVADAFQIVSLGLFIVADTLVALIVVFALQGVYRALESGPLDAWYVDAAQAADADADIERGLAQGGVVLGMAITVGSLASGGLVALGPIAGLDPLLLPLLTSLVLQIVHLVAVALLMAEPRRTRSLMSLGPSVRATPAIVRDAVRLVRGSTVLLALVTVELLWGFGMTAFETFTPVRLADVLGDPDRAGALLGPTNAAAWLISSAGAGAAPTLARRFGAAQAGAMLRVTQGLTVVGIALASGPIGVIAAYLATMGVHGAANPIHQGLLHRAVTGPSHRATIISANSLTAQGGFAIGAISLGALADLTALTTVMMLGAVILAAAAPLYVVAGRAARRIAPEAAT